MCELVSNIGLAFPATWGVQGGLANSNTGLVLQSGSKMKAIAPFPSFSLIEECIFRPWELWIKQRRVRVEVWSLIFLIKC